MFRKVFILIISMFLLSVFLLTYQWSMFKYGNDSENANPLHPNVKVSVKHKDGLLHIEQTIQGVKEGIYGITIPKSSEEFTCVYKTEEPCLLEDKASLKQVTVDSNEQLILEYQLPIKETQMIVTDWYVQLEQNEESVPFHLRVEVTEASKPFRQWIAPATLQADIEKEFIRYYQWEKLNAGSFPLINMIDDSYKLHQKGNLYLYSAVPLQTSFEEIYKAWEQSLNKGPSIIIVNPELAHITKTDYMIINEASLPTIQKGWLKGTIQSHYEISEEQNWLAEMMVHYILSEESEDPTISAMLKELRNGLTGNQRERFIGEVLTPDQEENFITALNQHLETSYGYPTPFFSVNQNKNSSVVPLYFVDYRSISVNGEDANVSWNAIIYEQERYFPLAGIAPLFGFDLAALPSESLYILRKDGESWRFSLDKKTFVHNEENFGVASDVLKQIQGEVYMKEQYVMELLGIDVDAGSAFLDLR